MTIGAGTVTITLNGRTSAPAPITIVPAAFGIFTLNQSGIGPGVFTRPELAVNSRMDATHLIGPFLPDTNYAGNTLVAADHPGEGVWARSRATTQPRRPRAA